MNLILFGLFLLMNSFLFAQNGVPKAFNVQGTIYQPASNNPFVGTANIQFQLLNQAGTCVMYQETVTGVDTTNTNGAFSVDLGTTPNRINNIDSTSALGINLFKNNVTYPSITGCTGAIVIGANETRKLRISFDVGSGYSVMTPDIDMLTAPYAMIAETLDGHSANEFIMANTSSGVQLSQANLETLLNTVTKFNTLNNFAATGNIAGNAATATTASSVSDGAITATKLAQMGASSGQVMKWNGSAWVASQDNSGVSAISSSDVTTALGYTPVNPATAVTSVAGRTGVVTLSSSDITGLSFGTTAGTFAQGNDSRFTDQRTPSNDSVTTAKILDGTITSADISSAAITFDKLNQSSATTGQVIKWNGSAWVASSDDTGAGGTVTSVTASGPLSSSGGGTPNITITQANGSTSGYLSSTDWTTFSAKLSNFSTLLSSDITSKLGYTPVNPATAVTSVAGRTGVVTLSSSDITGLSFGTTAGTFAQGNDSRFTDQRTPSNDSVTSAKILDGTITSADISVAAITFDKFNQSSATTGQVIKWNGSAWVASSDDSSGGTVTTVTASGPLSSSGGATPNITLSQANGTTSGYLSSTDWTAFSAKLSDFSTLLSSDITSKLGYTPVNPATAVTSVAGRTGVVTLSSSDITGLSFGTTAGTFAQGNDSRFTDQRTPSNDSVTSAKILDGTITSADISAAAITFDKLNQSSATTGQVIKWNGSAWVASSDDSSGGTVTTVTASGPLSSSGGATPNITLSQANGSTSGYLSSTDWTSFSAKLSDFSTLLSSDITSKLGYTPVNPATAVTSVAGRTGVVTLSSSDITGLSFGTTAGTYAQGNDSRFTDQRTPSNDSVTSAKILDGTITSADISAAAITFDKLNQSSATTGQVIKWNGSAWVASSDDSSGGTVTTVTASGPLSSSGGATPNITLSQANGSTSGYLSSTDWTSFSAKLSDFSTLLSSDITGKLGYVPVNPATAVTSVAGRTGVVTLSSSDITGLSFGTTAGTFAQGNDSRLSDQRMPSNDSVTTSKIVDGTITSSDLSNASIESNKLAQMGATTGQVMKWDGSAWVASSDTTNAGTVTSVSAAATTFNPITIGGTSAALTIDLAKATALVNGYLSSADWTTFNSKLSNFSTLTSSDITGKLGYTPANSNSAWSLNLSGDVSRGTGNIGIGTSSPAAALHVTSGQILGASALNSTSTINFATGNLQYTNSNCGAFALWNIKDGGSYSFSVKGTTSATCSFTAFSDSGTTPLTVHLPPNHTATTASKHTLYSLLVMGTDVYVAFIPGY